MKQTVKGRSAGTIYTNIKKQTGCHPVFPGNVSRSGEVRVKLHLLPLGNVAILRWPGKRGADGNAQLNYA